MSQSVITVEGSGHECDVKIETWLRDTLPYTPGMVRKVAKREFILTVREFYERSLAWRVVIGPKDLRAGKKRYTMSPYDAYADVVRVLGVDLEGRSLSQVFRQPIDPDRGGDRPRTYFLDSPDVIRLNPVPTISIPGELYFYVALTPKQSVSHLPRIAQTLHYDALKDGYLGRVYSHPAKPYSNPVLGQYHLQRFRAAIGSFAGLAKTGYADAPQWRYPRFGK
jgi:hypothetical protein